jgi:putative ABC transport system substrate-binding protein
MSRPRRRPAARGLRARRRREIANVEKLVGTSGMRSLPCRAGGLIAYGPDFVSTVRQATVQVDKILRGTKPGDIPIEQPTKFELVINLKTAKALGLTIPPSLLARADHIVE